MTQLNLLMTVCVWRPFDCIARLLPTVFASLPFGLSLTYILHSMMTVLYSFFGCVCNYLHTFVYDTHTPRPVKPKPPLYVVCICLDLD